MDIHEEARRISNQQKDKAARDAAKPVELKDTAVSGGPATAPADATKPAESKADSAVSGNPAPDAAAA